MRLRPLLLSLTLLALTADQSTATPDSNAVRRVRKADLVKNVYFMPYVTVSANLHSGQAFNKSANGLGFGAGIAFDLTADGQPLGVMMDFAWQDMRAHARKGWCMAVTDTSDYLTTVDAEHYYEYALFETFLKLQSDKANRYLIIGPSFGYATKALGIRKHPSDPQRDLSVSWEAIDEFNPFRLDIRAGVGILLGHLGPGELIFEARFGYPLLSALSNYSNICTGNGAGNWKIITIQGNIGMRL